MIKADKYYVENLLNIKEHGSYDENPRPKYKDGVPAYTKFITQVFEKYDISNNEFPITTLRNTAIKTGIKEILWIYQKQSNSLKDARDMGIKWWDEWNIGDGTIGHRYGYTINKYDLMNKLLNGLEKDPFGRRHIIDMYQYSNFNESDGLYPCAFMTLWTVRKVGNEMLLDLTLVQRSNDYIVSGYINKVQYVALQMMVASHLKFKCGNFSHLTQNCHVYDRHFDALDEILNRKPLDVQPMIRLKKCKKFYDFTIDDFEIVNVDRIQKLNASLEIAI